MSVAIAATISSTAGAGAGKWCFQWDISYADQDTDPDHNTYWLDNDSVHAPARYTYVVITGPGAGSGYFLDSNGCTPTMSISSFGTYHFFQKTYAKKGNRIVYVMPDGEDWESTFVDQYEWYFTTGPEIPPIKLFNPPPLNNERRLMPAVTTLMYQSSLLDWDDGTTHRVSTDVAIHYPHDKGCGSWADEYGTHNYHICISDQKTDDRFQIAHEFGHTITWMNDGPRDGQYEGSEGYFRASGDYDRCNCDLVGGYSHCPTSREFTGSGQKEGFSHFVGAAAYNAPYNTVPSNGAGVFFFYKDVMEASFTHYDDFPDIFEYPSTKGDTNPNASDAPFPTTLDTSSDVKWMEYECSPSGLTHYGTEWDWLDFYWNLWTEGSYKFTIPQIQNVWDNVPDPDIAYECCLGYYVGDDFVPVTCLPRDMTAQCGAGKYLAFPKQLTVGKLWEADGDYDVAEGVKDEAYDQYGSTDYYKYAHFRDTGDAAGVNH